MKITSAKKRPPPQVKVAVVGLGFMGATHLRAYLNLPSARIVAVCDPIRRPVGGILAGVAGNILKTGDIDLGRKVKVYEKLDQVLADPSVDLIDLCTPTPLHAEQAIASLKAGKHVLCEKPLAGTSTAAKEVCRVAEASPGCLMPAMCMRFWPGWNWLEQTIKQKVYGKMLAARFRRVSARPDWNRAGTGPGENHTGGALFDLHIHDTDFVNFLCGPPEAVFSTGVIGVAGSIDHVATQYIYRDGPAVCAEGSWLQATDFNMAFTAHCQRATLDFDFARGADALQISEPGQSPRSKRFGEADGYGAEIRYFVECVAARRRPTIVTAREGVTALEILEAEEESLRRGAVVRLRKSSTR